MTTTDLKPGDIVEHPEHGYGVVLKNFPGVPTIYFAGKHGYENTTRGFTGWERVETVRPGHVQVRVDDLTPGLSAGDDEAIRRLYLAWRKMPAQRAESTPPADEQNASATEAATYQCPWCSTDVNFSVALNRNPRGGVMAWVEADGAHTCPPAQPDEPTEPGTRVSVCEMRLVSLVQNSAGKRFFADVKSGRIYYWGDLTQRGTVTLGWDE